MDKHKADPYLSFELKINKASRDKASSRNARELRIKHKKQTEIAKRKLDMKIDDPIERLMSEALKE